MKQKIKCVLGGAASDSWVMKKKKKLDSTAVRAVQTFRILNCNQSNNLESYSHFYRQHEKWLTW